MPDSDWWRIKHAFNPMCHCIACEISGRDIEDLRFMLQVLRSRIYECDARLVSANRQVFEAWLDIDAHQGRGFDCLDRIDAEAAQGTIVLHGWRLFTPRSKIPHLVLWDSIEYPSISTPDVARQESLALTPADQSTLVRWADDWIEHLAEVLKNGEAHVSSVADQITSYPRAIKPRILRYTPVPDSFVTKMCDASQVKPEEFRCAHWFVDRFRHITREKLKSASKASRKLVQKKYEDHLQAPNGRRRVYSVSDVFRRPEWHRGFEIWLRTHYQILEGSNPNTVE